MEALQTIPEPKKTQPTLFKNNFLPILKPLFSALPWQLKKTYSEKETLLKMPENQDQLTHIKTYLFNKLSHHFQSKNFSKIITDLKLTSRAQLFTTKIHKTTPKDIFKQPLQLLQKHNCHMIAKLDTNQHPALKKLRTQFKKTNKTIDLYLKSNKTDSINSFITNTISTIDSMIAITETNFNLNNPIKEVSVNQTLTTYFRIFNRCRN